MADPKIEVKGLSNPAIASECTEALAACGKANGCFTSKGVLVSEDCIAYLAHHVRASSCLSKAFGFAQSGKK